MDGYNKKRTYIYLGGNISPDDRTYQWREDFTERLKDEERVVIVNPCANKFNQATRNVDEKKDVDGVEYLKEARKLSQDILMPKDYQMISICNVAVMNIELFYPDKPMIGTIFELAWCHRIFQIPIIGIMGTQESQKSNPYANHTWIQGVLSAKVRNEQQAAKIIDTFFLDY